MIECRHCDRFFNQAPEKIGARCPKCRLPLFESAPKKRGRVEETDKKLGDCQSHAGVSAIAQCAHCSKPICTVCRTRWNHQPVCPACVESAIVAGEPTAGEELRQSRHAWAGYFLAMGGWLLLLLTIFPFVTLHQGDSTRHQGTAAVLLFFLSIVPALFALGESAAALRLRGPRPTIALAGFCLCASQLGLVVGLILFNIWMN